MGVPKFRENLMGVPKFLFDINQTYDLIIRMTDTKERILDAAEKLFGENGYAATSLRQIISEAKVNLAAIHYHFGSKQELLDQAIIRKAGPMNERRLKLLEQFETESAPEAVPVKKIVEAFILPALLIEKSPEFVKLLGRVHAEGLMPEIARRNFQPMIARFLSVLQRALPDASEEELIWRAHFALGAMAHTVTARPDLDPGTASGSMESVVASLIAFVSSGFRAPATLKNKIEVNR